MLTKAFALLSQTFRVDVRQIRTHLLRGAIAAGVLWLLSIIHFDSHWRSSPGLEFFVGLSVSTLVLLTLMGAFYFPSVITEEKEEQTLGLLRMAGVNSVTLLLGKSVARVGVVLLLIAVSLPYWWLCVTLGGVTTTQIAAAAVCLAVHLALMSQIGTLCSVWFTTTGRACVASMIILLLLLFGPIFAEEMLRELRLIAPGNRIFQPLYQHLAPYQLAMIFSPGYASGIITTQVWTNAFAAAILFAISWLLLDRFNTYDQVPGRPSRLVTWAKSFLPAVVHGKRRARRAPSGPVGGAILWKDFWQFGGGYKWWVIRAIGYTFGACMFLFDGWSTPSRRIGAGLILSAFWVGIVEIIYHAAQMFQREIKNQTWDSLRMLPVSTASIVVRKILAALWALVPTLTALFLGILIEQSLFEEIWREFDRHPVISSCATLYFIAGTILAVYLTCYFSLRVNPWLGPVIAAALFGFVSASPIMCCVGLMGMNSNDSAGIVFLTAATVNLACVIGFHFPIAATLNGETSG